MCIEKWKFFSLENKAFAVKKMRSPGKHIFFTASALFSPLFVYRNRVKHTIKLKYALFNALFNTLFYLQDIL